MAKLVFNEKDHYEFAQKLMTENKFATPEDTKNVIFLYDKELGIYKPDGDIFIDKECIKHLEADASEMTVSYIKGIIKKTTYNKREVFDSKENLVCVKNGILNLDTLDLMPHTPEILFLRHIPVDWNLEATCPLFTKAVNTTFTTEEASYLQQFVGYGLLPRNVYKVATVIVGIPNTGKTKIAEAIRRLYGGRTYTSSLSLQDLSDRFMPAELEGKTINIRSEITPQDMKQWETFKSLVSTDIIPVQKKYGQPFSLENKAKFLFTSNSLPPVSSQQGVYERFIILVAKHDYNKNDDGDEDIDYKLDNENELSGMLKWAVDGYKILREHHGFYPKLDASKTRIVYDCWSGDSVSKYISTRLEIDLSHELPKDSVYRDYCTFCMEEGEPSKADNAFWRAVKERINIDTYQMSSSKDPRRPWMVKGVHFNMNPKTAETRNFT